MVQKWQKKCQKMALKLLLKLQIMQKMHSGLFCWFLSHNSVWKNTKNGTKLTKKWQKNGSKIMRQKCLNDLQNGTLCLELLSNLILIEQTWVLEKISTQSEKCDGFTSYMERNIFCLLFRFLLRKCCWLSVRKSFLGGQKHSYKDLSHTHLCTLLNHALSLKYH